MKKNRKKKILIIGFGSISKKLFNFLKGNTKYEIGVLRVFSKEKISGCKCFFKINDAIKFRAEYIFICCSCLLYTSDAADDSLRVDLGGRRIIKKSSSAVVLS